jgi:hypothetical protein
MVEYKQYQAVAQTVATDNLASFSLALSEDLEAFNRKAHLVNVQVTTRTAATAWFSVGYARNNGGAGSSADNEAVRLIEGFLRGPPPSAGFTTVASNTVNESSLRWDGDVFMGSGSSPPSGGIGSTGAGNHFIRGLAWAKMGSTVTFSVVAVVRFDG